ncbi:chondroitinase-B domain-containing protein [Solwaraspora sp. WMMD406]|uniref:chondroitinase-B domain-containing protein n=1 Tax=Solwaraspora sp. WMMD406 TaxID=3016095 RepID=UPI002416DA0C|nr:chondroitinase-B domain-containing protein [Solwaraspora sp. WMMD406]MDG4766798.1 chondroitinase-B domain-containing protein [Solwaraspora sp. WMMD406]
MVTTATGGVRVYGQDHRIYNNHFEGLTGTGYDAALQLDGGDVDTSGALSAHWRVYRITVVHNTFVNNASNIEIGANYTLAPVDSMVADNLVVGGQGKLFNELRTPVNMTYAGNIGWVTGSASVGVPEGVRVVDPLLSAQGEVYRIAPGSPAADTATGAYAFVTEDMDGQPRSGVPDVGPMNGPPPWSSGHRSPRRMSASTRSDNRIGIWSAATRALGGGPDCAGGSARARPGRRHPPAIERRRVLRHAAGRHVWRCSPSPSMPARTTSPSLR